MTDSDRALVDLAEAIAVGGAPPRVELARRVRRRRHAHFTFTAAGLVSVALFVGLLVPMLVSSGTRHTGKSGPSQVHLSADAVALAAGRQALAASGGPPVGSMGVVGPGQLWVLDGDGLFLSSNGGGRWTRVVPPSGGDPLADYMAIDFLSLRRGWLVAGRENSLQVDRTADGGSTWQSVSLPGSLFPSGWNSAEVSFIDRSEGWVLVQPYSKPGQRERSVVFSSTDGGAHWRVASRDVPVIDATFISPTVGWGLGAGGGSLYLTTDAGASWEPVTLPRPSGSGTSVSGSWRSLTLPVFAGQDGVLLAVPPTGNAVTERTTDGGRTWFGQTAPFTGEPAYSQPGSPVEGSACADCVGIGDEPFAVLGRVQWRYWAGGRLYTTTDAGRSWSSTQPNLSFANLGTTLGRVGVDNGGSSDPLQYSSPTVGWALASTNAANGQRSVLLVTNDGDTTFTALSPPRESLSAAGSSG
jgi:hypothetical protein